MVPGHSLTLGYCSSCKWACKGLYVAISHCERAALEVPINLRGLGFQGRALRPLTASGLRLVKASIRSGADEGGREGGGEFRAGLLVG